MIARIRLKNLEILNHVTATVTAICDFGSGVVELAMRHARYFSIEQHLLNYMTKSCIKIVISNYVGTFKKIDVEVLTFYKILIIVQLISK